MTDNINNTDKQQQPQLEACLVQMAEILKRLGIEELYISENAQSHIINTDVIVDKRLMDSFCQHVREMYEGIVAAG